MAKPYPILLYQYTQPFYRPVIWIKHQRSQRTQLRSPIPTITAMNKNINPLSQISRYLQRSTQYQEDEIVPLGICQK